MSRDLQRRALQQGPIMGVRYLIQVANLRMEITADHNIRRLLQCKVKKMCMHTSGEDTAPNRTSLAKPNNSFVHWIQTHCVSGTEAHQDLQTFQPEKHFKISRHKVRTSI